MDEQGTAFAEYLIVTGLFLLLVIGALFVFGGAVRAFLDDVITTLFDCLNFFNC